MQYSRTVRCLVTFIALLMAPVMAPAANATTELFQTDFGGTVHMGVPALGGTNGWWPILGGDDGFSWPITIAGGPGSGLQPISYGPTISWNPTNQVIDCGGSPCWKAEVISDIRHDGTTGAVFHQANYQNVYWQLPYIASPAADVPDEYQLLWVKFPANLAQQMGPNSWRVLSEWKTTSTLGTGENYDYRIAIYIYTDSSGTPYWYMTGTEHSAGPYYWTQSSHAPVPVGQWFKYEWAWHRTHDNTSFSKVWVNGNLIMDQEGGGSTCGGCNPVSGFYNSSAPINRIFLMQMYGAAGPTEQWFDHIEVWDSVPGSPGGGGGTGGGPTVPTNLSATAISASQVDLGWSASTDPNGLAGYLVYRNGTQVATVAGTSFADTGLAAGTTYSYTVAAYDSTGAVSAQSAPVSVTTQSLASSITTSATTVRAGRKLTAVVTNGPGDATDWIGLYPVGAPNDYALGSEWTYMNCTQVLPTAGITNATCNLRAWTTPGQYEFRLYDGVTLTLAAKSATITVRN